MRELAASRVGFGPRSSDFAMLTVAERPRGAPQRLDSVRKPRSPGGVRRSALASRSEELRFLLPLGPDASLIGREVARIFDPPKNPDPIAAISNTFGISSSHTTRARQLTPTAGGLLGPFNN